MRVLFTVALTVVVLAVALPAVEYVAVDRSEAATRDAVDRLVEAARTLTAGNDALANEAEAARRVVELDLPAGGFGSAPLVSLTIGPPDSATDRHENEPTRPGDDRAVAASRITWQVEGGRRHVRQVDGLRLRPRDGNRTAFRRAGDLSLVIRLVERDGLRFVTVARRARDVAARERSFKYGDGGRAGHAWAAIGVDG